MKKLLIIFALTLTIQCLNAQTRYAVYSNKDSAQKRLNSMNATVRFEARIHKDFITKEYAKVENDTVNNDWCIEILKGYERLFTKKELDNSICVKNSYFKKK
jgi:hypothetical protein